MEGGILRGYSNGTAVITCYVVGHESIKASCTVEVDITPELDYPSEIKLNTSSVTLDKIGDTYSLVPTLYPTNANIYNKSVSWSSSDSSVVSVENGTVKALKEGTAVITCSSSGNSSVSASCTVTVKATSTTDPSEQGKTDPAYTFKVRGGSLKSKSVFNGGDLANILITTDAPINKLKVVISNDGIQYNALSYDSQYDYYSFSMYARKKVNECSISITIDDKSVWSKIVSVSSDDKNWITYDAWLNEVISDINSDGSWNSADNLHKVLLVGQYILDNYDYDYDPMSAFHLNGKGNCNASANVLADVATRLGLRSDVVTPKAYVVNNPSHVVARVWYDGVAYLIEAGYQGKAGNRGTVTCVKASEQ